MKCRYAECQSRSSVENTLLCSQQASQNLSLILEVVNFHRFHRSLFTFRYYQTLLLSSIIMQVIYLLFLSLIMQIVKSEGYCGASNCYELLGVERDADQNTIKKAYRELAKIYHPDKNRAAGAMELFQLINKAYQTLTDEKARFKYDLHLQNPDQSDFYHEYRYYEKKFIQDPKIHPAIVVTTVIALISALQYVMRKQMYQRAIQQITEGQDFKNKVNERCGNNKKLKETVKQQMIEQISIEGGLSMPTYKDLLFYRIIVFPVTITTKFYRWICWIYKYNIKKQEYSQNDENLLTISALKISPKRWEHVSQQQRKKLVARKLWIKQNMVAYEKQMQEKWLEQLKSDKPRQYQMVMKHLKKNQ